MTEREATSCTFCGRSIHVVVWLMPIPDERLICRECTGLMVQQVETRLMRRPVLYVGKVAA